MPENREEMIDLYLKLVGEQHAKNICDEIENDKSEIDNLEYPHALDVWFETFHKARYKKQRAQKRRNTFYKFSARIAAVLIITAIVLGVITYSVEAFRIDFLNFFVNENSNSLHIVSKKVTQGDELLDGYRDLYVLGFVPEGFVLEDVQGIEGHIFTSYVRGEQQIHFGQDKGEVDISLDNERHKISYGKLSNGNKTIIAASDEDNIIVWQNDAYTFIIDGDIDLETLKKMAESIIWK